MFVCFHLHNCLRISRRWESRTAGVCSSHTDSFRHNKQLATSLLIQCSPSNCALPDASPERSQIKQIMTGYLFTVCLFGFSAVFQQWVEMVDVNGMKINLGGGWCPVAQWAKFYPIPTTTTQVVAWTIMTLFQIYLLHVLFHTVYVQKRCLGWLKTEFLYIFTKPVVENN